MDWLSELIKHITISKSFAGAVFLTSASLLSGPILLPAYFEPLPKGWAVPATGALIFSGISLFFWLVTAVFKLCSNLAVRFPQYLQSRSLTENEQGLMLANLADESLNLRNINYAAGSLSKLEVLTLSSSLSDKGLVSINPYDENLITLSAAGRRRALELKAKERTF